MIVQMFSGVGDWSWFLEGSAIVCLISAGITFKELLHKYRVRMGKFCSMQTLNYITWRNFLTLCPHLILQHFFFVYYKAISGVYSRVLLRLCCILVPLVIWEGLMVCCKIGGLKVMLLTCHFLMVGLMLSLWAMVFEMWLISKRPCKKFSAS